MALEVLSFEGQFTFAALKSQLLKRIESVYRQIYESFLLASNWALFVLRKFLEAFFAAVKVANLAHFVISSFESIKDFKANSTRKIALELIKISNSCLALSYLQHFEVIILIKFFLSHFIEFAFEVVKVQLKVEGRMIDISWFELLDKF